MKTCKTCKYWGRYIRTYCDNDGTDFHGNCKLNGFEVIATAADDTNLQVNLKTGPDFGCILHEEK